MFEKVMESKIGIAAISFVAGLGFGYLAFSPSDTPVMVEAPKNDNGKKKKKKKDKKADN